MKITGLITEYNPFHNGHLYHIQASKALTGADYIIVVMSGDFVQRGTPAILPKHLRAKMALLSGASLVLELPVRYATASAEAFAFGAVSLLDSLGCVDSLCFGSESGRLSQLLTLSELLSEESPEYQQYLRRFLKEGASFPAARKKAVETICPDEPLAGLLDSPNNILGVEYLKALRRLDSPIVPFTVQRKGAHYHDDRLDSALSSASAIRQLFADAEGLPGCPHPDFSRLELQMPPSALEIMRAEYRRHFPVYADDFSLLLKYRLLSETRETLLDYQDMSEPLANRIVRQKNELRSWEQFCELLKTKELTYARISRALLHVCLGIRRETKHTLHPAHEYARMLGFSRHDAPLLAKIKAHSRIPLLSRPSATKALSVRAGQTMAQEMFCSDLYQSVVTDKFRLPFTGEHSQSVIKI